MLWLAQLLQVCGGVGGGVDRDDYDHDRDDYDHDHDDYDRDRDEFPRKTLLFSAGGRRCAAAGGRSKVLGGASCAPNCTALHFVYVIALHCIIIL